MEENFKIGNVYSWDEVSEIHKSRNGIYQRNGELVSLLTDFGKINPCYPDFTGENADEIFYTGAGRRGDQKLDIWNKAMLSAIESKNKYPLFCKLKVNQWKFMGFWQITNGEYIFDDFRERMVWKFRLKRENTASRNKKSRSNIRE
ncbi:MAG TPA: hypothetical protein PKY82_35165 [Pyrinomonadaceae bacterium]|nr:hypothetical protein [Pyrinomonadaceae bacterium]